MLQVSIKGARALIKVYTDLQAAVEDLQSWFSVGLEPVIGLVSLLCIVMVSGRDSHSWRLMTSNRDFPILSRAVRVCSRTAVQSLQQCDEFYDIPRMTLTCLQCLLQLAQAGKRLSPSDPDKSRKPSATLPVWDMMRMLWRGQIGLTARSVHSATMPSPQPCPKKFFLLPHITSHAARQFSSAAYCWRLS